MNDDPVQAINGAFAGAVGKLLVFVVLASAGLLAVELVKRRFGDAGGLVAIPAFAGVLLLGFKLVMT